MIKTFSELGRRLRNLKSDPRSRERVERACAANGWFSAADIYRSAAAIDERMLRPELLAAWIGRYRVPVSVPRRILVAMAGNIPLVGFFDLLCVVAAGHRCLVKPAGKDRIMMEYVVELLQEIAPDIRLSPYDGDEPVDAVIATGSDNAVRYFRARYAGEPMLLRGHRQSVAVLSGEETPMQLAGLADDIWTYSGLGCRNVSLLWLPEGYDPAFGIPLVNDKYVNNYRQEKAILTMDAIPFVDLGSAVAVDQREFPKSLSRIAYARYRSIDEVVGWLAAHDREIQCVVSECIDHSRRVGFGCAQSPGLEDYPDAVDVMEWLAGL